MEDRDIWTGREYELNYNSSNSSLQAVNISTVNRGVKETSKRPRKWVSSKDPGRGYVQRF